LAERHETGSLLDALIVNVSVGVRVRFSFGVVVGVGVAVRLCVNALRVCRTRHL
jgi:hypothetical protein